MRNEYHKHTDHEELLFDHLLQNKAVKQQYLKTSIDLQRTRKT